MLKALGIIHGFVLVLLALGLSIDTAWADKPTDGKAKSTASAYGFTRSFVDNYISENLKDIPARFNLTVQNQGLVQYADKLFDGPDESNQDLDMIKQVTQAFLQNSYANPLIAAKPGRGKSHLLPLITMIYSYGAMPDHVRKYLQLDNPFLKKFYEQTINNTQIIKIDSGLLSLDPTPEGQAFPSQDERMKQIIQGLFSAAREDFTKNGRRTLFVFDEIAILPELVHQAMKTALDMTGFKDSANPLQKKLDAGISAIGMTTPWELKKMIKGDGAIQRRWVPILWQDLEANKAFDIGVKHVEDILKGKFNGLEIDELALDYIIQMNDFLFSPTQAMPDSTLKALDSLYSWFIFERSNNGENKKITLAEAQRWFLKQTGRTELWVEGPNGEVPFANLEAEVLKKYKGDSRIAKDLIHQICMPLKSWARSGFSGPPPVMILGSVTGGGKNTIAEALSMALYGNPGIHQRHSIGARRGMAFDQLFSGELGFGTHEGQLPLVVRRREEGSGPAIIVLDEGADAENKVFTDLKVAVESGIIQPISLDNRPRFLMEPIFILGEWSKEIFEGASSDDEIYQRYSQLTQEQIDNVFLEPKYVEKGHGTIPRSLLQRAKINGGVFIIPPTPRSSYAEIVDEKLENYRLELQRKNNLTLDLDPSVRDSIIARTLETKEDARGLVASMIKHTKHTIFSEGADKNLPYRNVHLRMTADESGIKIEVVDQPEKWAHIDFKQLFGNLASCDGKLSLLREK